MKQMILLWPREVHPFLHVMHDSGTTHVEGDGEACDEWERPRWLWNLHRDTSKSNLDSPSMNTYTSHLVHIDYGMDKPQACEGPDQVCGHHSWWASCQIEVGGKQEQGDVFNVVLVGPAAPLHIGVWKGDRALPPSGPRLIFVVCKSLQLSTMWLIWYKTWVDFDFVCSTVCPILIGLITICQNQLGSQAICWNIHILSQPNPGLRLDGTHCIFAMSPSWPSSALPSVVS